MFCCVYRKMFNADEPESLTFRRKSQLRPSDYVSHSLGNLIVLNEEQLNPGTAQARLEELRNAPSVEQERAALKKTIDEYTMTRFKLTKDYLVS